MTTSTRRAFLGGVGSSMLAVGLGSPLGARGALALALPGRRLDKLDFGPLEPLAALMQETPPGKLQRILIQKIRQGTELRTLVSAGALANARSFGGHDYTGYHCQMALMPAWEMSRQLPGEQRALPVLKVLYRNAARIQEKGGRGREALQALPEPAAATREESVARLRRAYLDRDVARAEGAFAELSRGGAAEAYADLQGILRENLDVHRVVLAWRAWEVLQLTGEEHARTLLRQSVRFCIDAEESRLRHGRPEPVLRALLPELLERHGLAGGEPEPRTVSDEEIEELSLVVLCCPRAEAAEAVARALASGMSLHDAGEALTVAANQLLLHDPGRQRNATPEKPLGSVHGASVGVHASDAARAWRNIAAVSSRGDAVASLIAGAYHTAGQTEHVGEKPFPYAECYGDVQKESAETMLEQLRAAVEAGDQKLASAVADCYGELGCPPRPLFQLLLEYALSEDGALHAEKYYRTACEDFDGGRAAFRWRHAIALARVTASQYGHPAPGYAEARELLAV